MTKKQTGEPKQPRKSKSQTQEEVMQTYNNWVENFARNVQLIGYTPPPFWGNSLMKDINVTPAIPTQDQLKEFLKNPSQHEKNLKDLSQYLENVQMLYKRAIYHFSSMLTFNYIMTPTGEWDIKTQEDFNRAKLAEGRAIDFLRRLRVKQTFRDIMQRMMAEDAMFIYMRDDGDYIDLQEMPFDYCKINGRNSLGYTYSFNMVYFARLGITQKGFPFGYFAPEFENWYHQFLEDWRKNPNIGTWYIDMPQDKCTVFKFDNTKAGIIPPMAGVMKDALEIDIYKALLRTKSELDTWKVIFLETPRDNDGKPTIDAGLVTQFVQAIQQRLPMGVKAVSAPMTASSFNFDSSQTMNQIIGKGENQFFMNSGISSSMYGGDAKSAGVLEYSIQSDQNFIQHALNYFQGFINYHLKRITGNYQFEIMFIQNDNWYNNDKNRDYYLRKAQFGGSKLMSNAVDGFEPHQMRNVFAYEKFLDLTNQMIPLQSSHTESLSNNGENHRPKKDSNDLTESGQASRDYDSNSSM